MLAFIAATVTGANAGCVDAPEIPEARLQAVQTLLLGENTTAIFHLYAESPSADKHSTFLLYSVAKNADATPSVYLAASSIDEEEKLLFTHNLSYYLPPVTRKAHTLRTQGAKKIPDTPLTGPFVVDGCLNTFTIEPDRQGIHLNLFVKSEAAKTEGANDVILVLLENNFIEPVLELSGTSWRVFSNSHSSSREDSLIAVLPSKTGVTEVIWQQFSKQEVTRMMGGEFSQNQLYRWEKKEFKKAAVLSPAELKERLKTAVQLPRSAAITQLRFEYKMPGPNQPAP